jgi:HEAT repeat protein
VKLTGIILLAGTLSLAQAPPASPPPASPTLEPRQRVRAVRDLAKQGSDSIPKLTPYLSDSDVSVRVETVKALIDIGGPRTVEPLILATKDNDSEIQIRAAEGLVNAYLPGYIKGGISGTLQRAGEAVRAKFGGVNDQVIDAFIAVRPEVISALGRLVRSGSSWESRAAAARALGVLRGKAALDDLVDAVHAKDDQLMYEALIAIQKIRDPSAGPRIAFRLRDLDDRIQIAAIDTTGILRNTDAAADVADVFDHARTPKIKRAAAETLAQLARPADRAFFVNWLSDRDDLIRAAGAEGLGRLKIPADRPALEKALPGEHNMDARLAVVFGLVSMGNLDTSDLAPFRYLINTLNAKAYKQAASVYLIELARDGQVRRTIYTLLPTLAKEEKIGLSGVLAASGDKDSVQMLETLSMDSDPEVAQEGIRSLRTLRARLP